ncbi:PqqD family peptide modification chaperone [Erythrobacter sp. MTPC3]|uniref:PqqD family peptide modification chaperone n=1 Tax=Erythrobacter sp. MTPC3 TaxID=3056564 RepID=UPI0036F35B4C
MTNSSSISLDDTVGKSENFVESSVDQETILMNLNEGNFSSLKSTGRRIWEMLDTPTKVSAICSSLQDEFDVEKDVCEAQTVSFLNGLHSEGFIEVEA